MPAHASAGDLDPTFKGDGQLTTDFTGRTDIGYPMALQDDGKMVVAGEAGIDSRNPKFALARYNPNGSLDTTFGADGKVTTDFTSGADYAYGMAIQANGKIVAAGDSGSRFALARYNTDGSLDTTFGGDGKVTTDFTLDDDDAYSVAVQEEARSWPAGPNPKFALARYNTNGSLDTTFGGAGKLTTDFTKNYDSIYTVLIQADGKIVAAGAAGLGGPNGNFALARYLAD